MTSKFYFISAFKFYWREIWIEKCFKTRINLFTNLIAIEVKVAINFHQKAFKKGERLKAFSLRQRTWLVKARGSRKAFELKIGHFISIKWLFPPILKFIIIIDIFPYFLISFTHSKCLFRYLFFFKHKQRAIANFSLISFNFPWWRIKNLSFLLHHEQFYKFFSSTAFPLLAACLPMSINPSYTIFLLHFPLSSQHTKNFHFWMSSKIKAGDWRKRKDKEKNPLDFTILNIAFRIWWRCRTAH